MVDARREVVQKYYRERAKQKQRDAQLKRELSQQCEIRSIQKISRRHLDELETLAAKFERNDLSCLRCMEASLRCSTYRFVTVTEPRFDTDGDFMKMLYRKASDVARRMGARIYSFNNERLMWISHTSIVFTWNSAHKAIYEDRTSLWQRWKLPSQKLYKLSIRTPNGPYSKSYPPVASPPGGPPLETSDEGQQVEGETGD